MYPYIADITLTDLGFGAGFALWGFRAIASGKGECCQLGVGFNRAFEMDNAQNQSQHGGAQGRLAINALKSFSYQLCQTGRRKIILCESGTVRITADEISIAGALSAAQSGNRNLCRAHLTWLLASSDTTLAEHAAMTYAILCAQAGIAIVTDHITLRREAKNVDHTVRFKDHPALHNAALAMH